MPKVMISDNCSLPNIGIEKINIQKGRRGLVIFSIKLGRDSIISGISVNEGSNTKLVKVALAKTFDLQIKGFKPKTLLCNFARGGKQKFALYYNTSK